MIFLYTHNVKMEAVVVLNRETKIEKQSQIHKFRSTTNLPYILPFPILNQFLSFLANLNPKYKFKLMEQC